MNIIEKNSRKKSRAVRVHAVAKASGHVRLVVYRSNTTIHAQLMNDATGKIVCGTSGIKSKLTGVKMAEEVGTTIAELAKKNKISQVSFDRNGYKYHGQVKALADAARKGGLVF